MRFCLLCYTLLRCNYILIITPDGLKLCEINTHPAADYEQVMCNPILTNGDARKFFASKGLFELNTNEFYDLYMQCQV